MAQAHEITPGKQTMRGGMSLKKQRTLAPDAGCALPSISIIPEHGVSRHRYTPPSAAPDGWVERALRKAGRALQLRSNMAAWR